MSRIHVIAFIIGVIFIGSIAASLKQKQCEYIAPDHVTACMLMK